MVDQIASQGVPKKVGMYPSPECIFPQPVDETPDLAGGEGVASGGLEQVVSRPSPAAKLLEAVEGFKWRCDYTGLPAFTLDHCDSAPLEVNVADAEVEDLSAPEAGSGEGADQDAIAGAPEGLGDGLDEAVDVGQSKQFHNGFSSKLSIAHDFTARQKFVLKKVRGALWHAGLWSKFKARWRDLAWAKMQTPRRGGKVVSARPWVAFEDTCAELAPDLLARASDAWKKLQSGRILSLQDATARRKMLDSLSLLDQIDVITVIKQVEEDLMSENHKERANLIEMRKVVAEQLRAETQKILAEAKLEATQAAREKQAQEQAKVPEGPKVLGGPKVVEVQGGGWDAPPVYLEDASVPFDLTRDTKWVLANLPRLGIRNALGLMVMDAKVARTAPSNAAITLGAYALKKPDKFIETFVMRLLPREAATEAKTTDVRLEDMDESEPDLEGFQALEGEADAAT